MGFGLGLKVNLQWIFSTHDVCSAPVVYVHPEVIAKWKSCQCFRVPVIRTSDSISTPKSVSTICSMIQTWVIGYPQQNYSIINF